MTALYKRIVAITENSKLDMLLTSFYCYLMCNDSNICWKGYASIEDNADGPSHFIQKNGVISYWQQWKNFSSYMINSKTITAEDFIGLFHYQSIFADTIKLIEDYKVTRITQIKKYKMGYYND
jgi:hypothetical protein